MLEKIKRIHRALLELWLGILFVGLLLQFIGMWFAKNWILYTVALWVGIVVALLMVLHMYKTLDKALELGPGAQKSMLIANMVRYICVVIVFVIILLTDILNPLITFMGVMTVKVAAYLQPFTHKLCNKIFHETDPIPESIPDDEEFDEEEEF